MWNFNKRGGVIGAFNCQGAGWNSKEQRIMGYPECYKPVSGSVHVTDIEWDQRPEVAHMCEAEQFVVYLNQSEELVLMTPKSDSTQMTVQPSSFELFSFVPVKKLGPMIKFAPVGLINMFNSGGTVQELKPFDSGAEICVKIDVKGGGNFLAYAGGSPKKCYLNGAEVDFEWSTERKLTLNVPWIEEAGGISAVVLLFRG